MSHSLVLPVFSWIRSELLQGWQVEFVQKNGQVKTSEISKSGFVTLPEGVTVGAILIQNERFELTEKLSAKVWVKIALTLRDELLQSIS
jgi:hypothetical protein